MLEQVELALARRGELAQGVELRGEAADLGERLGACAQAQRVIGAAERVEDLQLGAREGQLAVLVLAVEGDEPRAVLAQLRDGGGAAVEVGARASVGAETASEDDLLGVVRAAAQRARSAASRADQRHPRHRPPKRRGE